MPSGLQNCRSCAQEMVIFRFTIDFLEVEYYKGTLSTHP